jgi:hypothetical protein
MIEASSKAKNKIKYVFLTGYNAQPLLIYFPESTIREC